MIKLDLPYPPSTNSYWRHIAIQGKPRSLISAKGRAYREAVKASCWTQWPTINCTGPLSVSIDAYPPDRRKRDLDNTLKALLDAITHAGIWMDDSQIDRLTVTRREVESGGRVVVVIDEQGN